MKREEGRVKREEWCIAWDAWHLTKWCLVFIILYITKERKNAMPTDKKQQGKSNGHKMKPPKGFLRFFNPASDDHFKKKHPIGYGFLVALGIFAFILPLIVLTIVIEVCEGKPSGWFVLALGGCIIMGVGLFNLVAIIIKQYLGHLVTIICLLGGGALVGISSIFMFVPEVYALVDDELTTFFFVTNAFYVFIAIFYVTFRGGVQNHLEQRGIKTRGKMKGARSFWFYSELHKSKKIGFIYVINLIFIISYMLLGALILCGGYFRVMQMPICIAFSICSVLLSIMNAFASDENFGYRLMLMLIPCIVAYAQWQLIF